MRTKNGIKLAMAAAAVAFGLVAAQSAMAAPTNGDFSAVNNDGITPTGYTTLGDAGVSIPGAATFNTHYTPGTVNNTGFLSSSTDASTTNSGTAATTNVGSLESFANLASGSLTALNVKSGSAIKQTFTANAGDQITLDYDFATNDTQGDFAFASLLGPGGTTATLLPFATAGQPGLTHPVPTTFDANNDNSEIFGFASNGGGFETGSKTLTLQIGQAGTYTLALGVTNVGDLNAPSALIVDNIAEGAATSVPLPAAAFLAPIGMAIAGRYAKKLRKQQEA